MLGAASSEVITWMKDKGRSFGVRPMLATSVRISLMLDSALPSRSTRWFLSASGTLTRLRRLLSQLRAVG
jgi:hypothetical protein